MDIVLQEKDNIEELYYKGKPILKHKHRIFNDDGRIIIQLGDMNKLAVDDSKLVKNLENNS